jgi:hypothetical protein
MRRLIEHFMSVVHQGLECNKNGTVSVIQTNVFISRFSTSSGQERPLSDVHNQRFLTHFLI